MRTIWKFPLEITDAQEIEMPLGSTPLSVGVLRNAPYLWAKVQDTNTDHEKWRIHIVVDTGNYLLTYVEQYYKFLGAVQIENVCNLCSCPCEHDITFVLHIWARRI